ncbi:unnamed protein product [Victoria cruziana]
MKEIYSLKQGELPVSEYYRILKSKWEVIDYMADEEWDTVKDQTTHWKKEWKNRIFIFLRALNNDYENVRNQILNSGELPSIEKVYSKVEAEE